MVKDLLKNEGIVVLEQFVVSIPCLCRRDMVNGSKIVEYTRRRLGAIVEKKHDPSINDQAVLGSQNNRSLVVRVVIREVAQCLQHLGRLVRCENVVPTPDFVILRMCLHSVGCDDAEIVASAFQRSEEILYTCVSMFLLEIGSLTLVLLLIGIDHCSIGKYNLIIDDIVGCPAVLGTQKAHTTY